MLRQYGFLIRDSAARRFLVASFTARWAFALLPLSVILHIVAKTGSFSRAGLALGSFSLTSSLLAPLRGRTIDRAGRRSLGAFTVPFVVLLLVIGFVPGVSSSAPSSIAALGLLGAVAPPVAAITRAVWGTAFQTATETQAAYALDSSIERFMSVIGPVIAGAVASFSTEASIMLCALLMAIGGAYVTASTFPQQMQDAAAERSGTNQASTVALVAALASLFAIGSTLGALDVVLPLFAQEQSSRIGAGLLLGMFSLGSVLGSLWYGSRSWRWPPEWRYPVLTAAFAVGLLPLQLAASMVTMTWLVTMAGFALGPCFITVFMIVDKHSRHHGEVEAFTWATTLSNAGLAAGAATAGWLVERTTGAYALRMIALAAASGALLSLASLAKAGHPQ